MKKIILSLLALSICVVFTLTAYPQVTIDWNDQHQQIDGFGASCAWTADRINNKQADLFFSVEEGIGLSLLRNRIAPDGTTGELATMKKAQARGAKIWSTPWSPPAEWKTNNAVNYGGRLKYSYYHDYADLLAQYVQDMKDEGINLHAISVQNESDYAAEWESCLWSGDELHSFVPYLYSALTTKGLTSTKIMIAEQAGWNFDLTSSTMDDPDTASMVGILAAHNYSGSPYSYVDTFGKQLWQTEVSSFDPFDGSVDNALRWAKKIHEFMTIAEANAWHYWWLIPLAGDNQGLLDKRGKPAKRMWAIGNFSKFVRPGYYRIGASDPEYILVSAYKDPNTGRVTIVAINDNDVSIEETFNLINFYPALMVPWITSASISLEQQPSIEISGNSFTYTLPALSIVTFVEDVVVDGTAADFSATPLSGAEPLQVTFTDLSTGAHSWSWDFDDDGIEDSTLQNPSYMYDMPGRYTVSLTVTGPGGTDTETKTDYITVTVTSQVIIDNDEAGTSSTGNWKISSGGNHYGSNSRYNYKAKGTYTWQANLNGIYEVAMWWVSDEDWCTDVPVDIYDETVLLDTVYVDQTVNGGRWIFLGSSAYNFSGIARVVITTQKGCGTNADAVRFKPPVPPNLD